MQFYNMRKCFGLGIFLLIGVFFLTGCSSDIRMSNDMKNPEERDYATVLIVSQNEEQDAYHFVLGMAQEKVKGEKSMVEEVSEWDAKNVEELARNYGNVMGKDLSLAHLKTILFCEVLEEGIDSVWVKRDHTEQSHKTMQTMNTMGEEGIMPISLDLAWQEPLLYMLDQEHEIAKTCPVLILSEYEEFIHFLKEEEEPVGNYLENLVRTQERQGVDVPWLKDYLQALRENKIMEIMYLQKEEEGWRIAY